MTPGAYDRLARSSGPRWPICSRLALVLLAGTFAVGCSDDGRSGGRERTPASATKLAPVAKVESTDAWMDLIAQRPSAVVVRQERVWIDLGHPSARKHLELAAAGTPWRLAQDVDGRRAAIVEGHGGALDIPLDGLLSPSLNPDTPWSPKPGEEIPEEPPPPERGLAMAITLRALAPDQSVTVLWEERPLANLRLSQEWERRTLSLPGDLVVTGENRLRLHFRHVAPLGEEQEPDVGSETGQPEGSEDLGERPLVSAAIESVEIASLDTIRAGPPATTSENDYEIRSLGEDVEFEVPADRSLVYYLVPPRRARLRIEVAGRGSLEIYASTDADHRHGRAPAQLRQTPLRADGRSVSVDLSGYGETPTRLEIHVRSTRTVKPGQKSERGGALFRALDIVANRTMPIDRRDRTPRDVYILGLEGARPDDLFDGALGAIAASPSYPAIADFLAESLIFERAYALHAAAVPSHAGVLTSINPRAHLTVRGTHVAEGRTSLAEALDRAGYFNSSVTANSDFNNGRGLTQGFADHQILERSNTRGNDAQKIVLAMLEEVAQRPRPRFIYAVFSDAQAPYDPPSEVLGNIAVPEEAPAQHRTHMWVGRVRTKKIEPDRKQLEYVRRLYRGELQVIDQALGVLLEALAERGELDEAVIVLVGVHGEEFLEHESAGHGRTLFEESIHVPLAIRAPQLLAPGRVEVPIDLLDLAPTLTDLLGVRYDPSWQGQSLVPLIDDPQPPPRLVVSYLGDGSRAAIIGNHKFILGPGRGRETQHLYDLVRDPGEREDRIAEGGVALRMLRTALGWEMAEQPDWSRPRWGTGAKLEPAFALDHGL